VAAKAFAITLLFISIAVAVNLWVFPPYPRTNWYELPVPTITIAAICAFLITAFATIKGDHPASSFAKYLTAVLIALIAFALVFCVSLLLILNLKGA
jgi:hypothetical protein